ncbi:MAG: COX15/CtaA family protein [Hyphomonadaceae bacterium]|nr:COX15/CtaA family protein [Hyphomonadaceae bacterium]
MTLMQTKMDSRIAAWLLVMILLVVTMIVLGGATRLTNSGLSITEWKPITGAIPPLSRADWMAEFEKYKQIPEFEAEHPDMTLREFEFIYFMEWAHRQLGRVIGLAYALPFLWWGSRGRLPSGQFFRFFLILLLIGVQGAIGWWMVASGLAHGRVDVSQYRLATHLGLAFIILALLYWTWRDQREGWTLCPDRPLLKKHSFILFWLVFLQIISGAFVAGTHSGKSYNTWPFMDGGFIPNGYGVMSPIWKNAFENTAAIQFNHRVIAYAILLLSAILLVRAMISGSLRNPAMLLVILTLWQTALGIWTLLSGAPLWQSLAHQFSAILVFLAALSMWRAARRGY